MGTGHTRGGLCQIKMKKRSLFIEQYDKVSYPTQKSLKTLNSTYTFYLYGKFIR